MFVFVLSLYRIGPLVNCWCMRMEAKNSFFKRVAQIGNYRNVPYSVSARHQRLCAYLQGPFFTYEDLECGPCMSARVYKRRERECPTSYCCVQTPFAKYRGQCGQHYIKVTTNQYRFSPYHCSLDHYHACKYKRVVICQTFVVSLCVRCVT